MLFCDRVVILCERVEGGLHCKVASDGPGDGSGDKVPVEVDDGEEKLTGDEIAEIGECEELDILVWALSKCVVETWVDETSGPEVELLAEGNENGSGVNEAGGDIWS